MNIAAIITDTLITIISITDNKSVLCLLFLYLCFVLCHYIFYDYIEFIYETENRQNVWICARVPRLFFTDKHHHIIIIIYSQEHRI